MSGEPLARAESVARGLARKLRALESERAAEAIDSDALFNQLERSHAALRAERDSLSKKHAALASEQAKAGQDRQALVETVEALRREKREHELQLRRLTTAERTWEEERLRLNGLLESRAAHNASLERELAAERERLQEAHKVSQERATAFAEKQAEWLDASMTAQSQASQIELLQRRLLEEQAHGTARRGDVEAARRQREEQIQQLLNEKEDIAREKLALETKLQGALQRESTANSEVERLREQLTAQMTAASDEIQLTQRRLVETERLSATYKKAMEDAEKNLASAHAALDAANEELRAANMRAADTAAATHSTPVPVLMPPPSTPVQLSGAAATRNRGTPGSAVRGETAALLEAAAPEAGLTLVGVAEAATMNRAELYSRYAEAIEVVMKMKHEKENAEEELAAVVRDVAAKAPRIMEQRRRLEDLSDAHEALAIRLQAALDEGDASATREEECALKLEKSEQRIAELELEVADVSRQLQLVLHESQRRTSTETPRSARGHLGAPATPAATGALPPPPTPAGAAPTPTPLFGIAAAARAAGGGRSPAATPSPFGRTPASSSGPPADLSTPSGVISARLVPFKDVQEMQQQNAALLRTIRRLGAAHESQLKEQELAASQAVKDALAEVEVLRQEAVKQQKMVDELLAQREMYRAIRPASAPSAVGPAASETLLAEAASLRDEIATLREEAAENEAALEAQLKRAQESEAKALQAKAHAEAKVTVLETHLAAQANTLAAGGADADAARKAQAELSQQLLKTQRALAERGEALSTAEAEARRQANLASLAQQEKKLLEDASDRQRQELKSQSLAMAQLRELLSQLQDMHSAQTKAEQTTAARLQSENERLQSEWLNAHAALSRATERAAEEARSAAARLDAAGERAEALEGALAAAREEAANLRQQVETLHSLHEAHKLQLADAGIDPSALAAASTTASAPASASPRPSSSGGSCGGALAEELALARRARKQAEESLAAEKAHTTQYRALAAAAEKEKEEQMKLSTELKASFEAKLNEASAAKNVAEERLAAVLKDDKERKAEMESLRAALRAAKEEAAAATAKEREVISSAEEVAGAHKAEVEALQVQLRAAKQAEERALAKYRTELQNHSADAQELTKAKEAAAAAEESLRAAVAARATAESEASNARALAAAAKAEVASRIKDVEERLAAAAEENKLLHAQLTKLAAYATVAAATTASSPAGRREMGAIAAGGSTSPAFGTKASPGSAGASQSADEESSMLKLLTVVRRDKEMLSKKLELAQLEARRLTQENESLERHREATHHRLSEALSKLARLEEASSAARAADTARELSLLRDSNAMMARREAARETELKKITAEAERARSELEPLKESLTTKVQENEALAAQIDSLRKELQQWQERSRKLLAKDKASVAAEQHDKLVAEKTALASELATTKALLARVQADLDAQKPALDKATGELQAALQLQDRLRKAGGGFKAQAQEREKERDAERTAKLAAEEDARAATAAATAATAKLTELQATHEALGKTEAQLRLDLAVAQEQAAKYMRGYRAAKESEKASTRELEEMKAAATASGMHLSMPVQTTQVASTLEAGSTPAPAAARGRGAGRAAKRARAAAKGGAAVTTPSTTPGATLRLAEPATTPSAAVSASAATASAPAPAPAASGASSSSTDAAAQLVASTPVGSGTTVSASESSSDVQDAVSAQPETSAGAKRSASAPTSTEPARKAPRGDEKVTLPGTEAEEGELDEGSGEDGEEDVEETEGDDEVEGEDLEEVE